MKRKKLEWLTLPQLLTIFIPTALLTSASYSIIPAIPSLSKTMGLDLTQTGLILAMLMTGQLLGALPAGWLVSKYNERTIMVWAFLAIIPFLTATILYPNPILLSLTLLIMGYATSTFAVARHTLLTLSTPVNYRGRVISSLSGTVRIGWAAGPLASGLIIQLTGNVWSTLFLSLGFVLIALALMVFTPKPSVKEVKQPQTKKHLIQTIRSNKPVLFKTAPIFFLLSVLRGTRTVLLLLWAASLSINPVETSYIIGFTAAIEIALFYFAGVIVDRYGYLWAGVPSMIGLILGLVMLSGLGWASEPKTFLIGAAVVLAVANALGSGFLDILATSHSPQNNPAPLLSAYRLISDSGSAAAPYIVTLLTLVTILPVTTLAVAAIGVTGVIVLIRNGKTN